MIQIIVDTVWQTLGVCALIFIPVVVYIKKNEDSNK